MARGSAREAVEALPNLAVTHSWPAAGVAARIVLWTRRPHAATTDKQEARLRRTAALALAAALTTAIVAAGTAGAATTTSVVKLTALASGLKYNTKVLHAHPGKIKIVFTNQSPLQHNVRIESGETELGGTKKITKGQTVAYVTLKKGTYNFYCSVPGHEDAGMHGKLIVS